MTRIACKIKWDGSVFRAYDLENKPIPTYSNLCYGKTDTGKDDAVESTKTLLASKQPDTTHICDGFVDIP